MNIGFDLDKIFIETPPFIPDVVIDKLYRKRANGVLLYRIPSKPEQIIRILSHASLLRPIMKYNINYVRSIKTEKNKLFLISSRFGFLKNKTEHVMKGHGFDNIFDDMFFNYENKQPHIFKNAIIKRLKIKKYVDDDLPLLLYLAKKNKEVAFFWLNKRHTKLMFKNLHAITHLSMMFQK